MFRFIGLCFGTLVHLLRARRSLLLENLALRQQLAVLKRRHPRPRLGDRKSTRLNSSHTVISYAVFCLKKKKRKAISDEGLRPEAADTIAILMNVFTHVCLGMR